MAWFDELDDDSKAHAQSKGWDKMEPEQAAREAARAHREFEKWRGVRQEEIARIPQKPDDPAWGDLYKRLGKPEKPDDYSLEGVKFKDGSEPDEAFVKLTRSLAHELNLPITAASRMAQAFIDYADNDASAAATTAATRRAAEQAILDNQWGKDKDLNTFLAQKGAELMGFDKEVIDKIEGTVGYAKTMEAFKLIGERAGEAKFHTGGGQDGNVPMFTREQAIQEKSRLANDTGFMKKWMDGDVDCRKRLLDLDVIIVGSPQQWAQR